MKNINFWVVRPNPAGNNRIDEFFEKNIIAIGGFNIPNLLNIYKWENLELKNKWKASELMDNFDYSSRNNKWIRNNIKIKLTKINPDDTSSQKIALHAGVLFRFFQEIKKEDIVFVPDKDKLHIAQVMGPYIYSTEDKEEEYPHQRKVKWIQKNIDRKSIPSYLQKSLSSKLTLYSISDNYDEIMEFIRGIIPNKSIDNFEPTYNNLSEAVYMEVFKKYGSPHKYQLSIFNLAKTSINQPTIKRAKEIAEKVRVFCGNGMWRNDKDRYLFRDDTWVFDIMKLVEEKKLDESIENEKEKLFQDAEEKLKEALKEAEQSNDLDSLTETIQSLEEKEELIEDFQTKTVQSLLSKLDGKRKEILEKAYENQMYNYFQLVMKNASGDEKEKLMDMIKDKLKEDGDSEESEK